MLSLLLFALGSTYNPPDLHRFYTHQLEIELRDKDDRAAKELSFFSVNELGSKFAYPLTCPAELRSADGLSCTIGSVPDGEGQPATEITVRGRSLPIERIYPNLRSYRFETTYKENQECFDCAGNNLVPGYLIWMPRIINVFDLYKKRVLLDLGAGSWGGSSLGTLRGLDGWLAAYPGGLNEGLAMQNPNLEGKIRWQWGNSSLWTQYHEFDYMSNMGDSEIKRPPWVGGDIEYQYHNRMVTSKPANELDSGTEINLGDYIMNNFHKDDFLHVKMDIENCEWSVLESMVEDGTIDYVDELTVEFHFTTDDPAWQHFLNAAGLTTDKMFNPNAPCNMMHTREEAYAMLQRLRDLGVYTHVYP
jgi:hypothetical protein